MDIFWGLLECVQERLIHVEYYDFLDLLIPAARFHTSRSLRDLFSELLADLILHVSHVVPAPDYLLYDLLLLFRIAFDIIGIVRNGILVQ